MSKKVKNKLVKVTAETQPETQPIDITSESRTVMIGEMAYQVEVVAGLAGTIAEKISYAANDLAKIAKKIKDNPETYETVVKNALKLAALVTTAARITTPAGQATFLIMNAPNIISLGRDIYNFIYSDEVPQAAKELVDNIKSDTRTLTGIYRDTVTQIEDSNTRTVILDNEDTDSKTLKDNSYAQQINDAYLYATSYFSGDTTLEKDTSEANEKDSVKAATSPVKKTTKVKSKSKAKAKAKAKPKSKAKTKTPNATQSVKQKDEAPQDEAQKSEAGWFTNGITSSVTSSVAGGADYVLSFFKSTPKVDDKKEQ